MRRGFAVLMVCSACGNDVREVAPKHGTLPEGTVARVADELIDGHTVARIAQAQSVSARVARERAIQDALAALAVQSDPERRALARLAEQAAQSRMLLDQLKEQAKQQGPPTPAEVERIVRERWQEFDRPEGVKTTHAVVLLKDEKSSAKAREVAERLAEALRGIKDPGEFIRRANDVPSDGLDLRAERLPAVARDGRAFDPENPGAVSGMSFDQEFARAAHELTEAGAQSGVVKTKFGYHVILLEQRVPAKHVSGAELRVLLTDEIIMRRSQHLEREVKSRVRQGRNVEIDRAADDLMARVRTAP